MDLTSIKQIIIAFLVKYKDIIINNIKVVTLIIIIILTIYIAYNLSEKNRIDKKIKYIDNNLVYDSPRISLDLCGIDNNIIDKLTGEIKINFNDNSIEFINTNINLWDYNLSSEFVVEINKTNKYNTNINEPLKIKYIDPNNSNKLVFTNDIKIKNPDSSDDVVTKTFAEITFYNIREKINKYKYKKLHDYYICSSYNCFLVGNQFIDYCSYDMIKKVLYFGARYIELPIFDKEKIDDTIPIVYNELGGVMVTLNYLELDEIIKIIGDLAFNRRFIENYEDPLFIYLNLKTNNIKTLNKVSNIIKKYLYEYLLSPKFNHINIATHNLCTFKKKCVILSSSGYLNSELNNIINCSSDKSYLNRITFNEALINKDELTGPKFEITSSLIMFKSNGNYFNDYIEVNDSNLNFLNYGIVKGDGLYISGSENPNNNSGEYMFLIESVTKNKIVFNKKVNLVDEINGKYIIIKIYDKDSKKEYIEEYNKNNLTIVIPDSRFLSTNNNYKNIFYKGCQFVAMNFQNIDANMKNYFNYFSKKSFQFKPLVLINSVNIPKSVSLNSIVPSINIDFVLDINYNLIEVIRDNRKVSIIPYNNIKLRLVKSTHAIFSLNHANSYFNLEKGLNKKSGFISIKSTDGNYLTYSKTGCYLTFKSNKSLTSLTTSALSSENNSNETKDLMSFVSLQSPLPKKGYSCLGVVKKNKNNKDILYYLKIRSQFSSKKKLFIKETKKYETKVILNYIGTEEQIVILKPKEIEGFYPVGDIALKLTNEDIEKIVSNIPSTSSNQEIEPVIKDYQEKISTNLYSGAVDRPYGYELIWDNKKGNNNNNNSLKEISVWKPLANEGFMAAGVVIQKGFDEPSLNEVVCISVDYLEESTRKLVDDDDNDIDIDQSSTNLIDDDPVLEYGDNSNQDEILNNLTLWKNESNYINAYPFSEKQYSKYIVPNAIDFQMYKIIDEDINFYDRLYLSSDISNKKEKESCLLKFNFDSLPEGKSNEIYDYLMDLENTNGKIISYTPSENGKKMCMALPQPYWSSFYQDVSEESSSKPDRGGPINNKVNVEACKTRDYFGTNWNIYNDKTIRLEGNKNSCLTYNGDPQQDISVDINDDNNFVYLDECRNDLRNQMFNYENNNIKVVTNTNYEPNACVTHTPDDELRLEECGDKKFSVISKWNNKISRKDKCSKIDAEKELQEVNSIEECKDLSYYVVYISSMFPTHDEYCNLEDAKAKYELEKDKQKRGIGIIHKSKILEKKLRSTYDIKVLENYIIHLGNQTGECYICKKPSSVLCVNNSIIKSDYNVFNNDEEKMEISDYCSNLKNDESFKCSRGYRQKFINNINPNNYCMTENKTIYFYFNGQYNNIINTIRPKYNDTFNQGPIDNLLGEEIDLENYHLFFKGMLTPSNNTNKYKIVFDFFDSDNSVKDKLTNIGLNITNKNTNVIDELKFSTDIILDYRPKYDEVDIGTKVLAVNNYKTNNDYDGQYGDDMRFMAVITKKLENNKVEVMFSINSYDPLSRIDTATEINRPSEMTNPKYIYNINDLVLLKKAPLCV